ncbi:MAG: pyruvate:ferredoxin (flavodoxin) oxidoreductase [Candidatus Kapabacteria bacterium]|nr:pyruvate:ferredoxin (flavodoxin) oxidoreductase [Candidatus Kapabacteria bacterium]
MKEKKYVTIDGNEAAAYVAYRVNEVCAIYPITPSSNMGEWCDEWASKGIKNIWGAIPTVQEMQSEGGAAGAVHGSLQAGALTTTFTASQGLLLKIPNMYKIAGELTSTVFNISARTLATHALSIFGDHSDVMSARQTGFAMLSSASVQEVMDFTLIAQAATLESRIPFVHFFDGFRTSHEVSKIEVIDDEIMHELVTDELVVAHRNRSLSPDHPVLRGTAQNPDVFFQNRETANQYYWDCPDVVQNAMDKFASLTGRQYKLYEYEGAPDADKVIVLMGSGCETAHETLEYFTAKGEKIGIIKVRLFRPFDVKRFVEIFPATTKAIAVLDRTKEPGAIGEPLYQDVINALFEGINNGWGALTSMPKIVGGRYGLSSKEFTPTMIKAVYDNIAKEHPKNHFTIGINDDVSHTSLDYDHHLDIETENVIRAQFYGLGSDGTVGANKNSIKIIGENTPNYAQGYFVYDSKKAGTMTVSHLRFGPNPIRSAYLINQANFVACHQTVFLEKIDLLKSIAPNGVFLINSPFSKDDVWDTLPRTTQKHIVDNNVKIYTIDAQRVAEESGMGRRINTVMQVCFFAISGILPREEAIDQIKKSIKKTYSKKGDAVVEQNLKAVDNTLEHLYEVEHQPQVTSSFDIASPVPDNAPDFVKKTLGEIISFRGDDLPVSAFPIDGTYPLATTQYERRNIALQIPVWDESICIQCGKCAVICPHAAIRIKVYDSELLKDAPATFKSMDASDKEYKGMKYTVQVAPEDCTGCNVCFEICPVKNKKQPELKSLNMRPQPPLRKAESENWAFFMDIPDMDRRNIKVGNLRQQQLQRPLFEFSGACAGCGETPYVKLVSQLWGDRSVVANATGCSSIYGGNLPTTPWAKDSEGRGTAWSNSLFEDNAEFGFGFRLAIDKQKDMAIILLNKLASQLGDNLILDLVNAPQKDEADIYNQRERVKILKDKLSQINTPDARALISVADYLVKKSVWIMGGDGWAYDIGFGGLDHVIAQDKDVNLLVLDTEVYSNTGGQMSKSTPLGGIAKFSAGGKLTKKKDLGLMAMSYGTCYVASVAMGAKDEHTLKTFLEAEAFDGPSLIIAYSHCIAHGFDMDYPLRQQKLAVETGQWLLYRFNPDRLKQGLNPLQLDSKEPKTPISEFLNSESRFQMLNKIKPEEAKVVYEIAQQQVIERYQSYKYMADRKFEEIVKA